MTMLPTTSDGLTTDVRVTTPEDVRVFIARHRLTQAGLAKLLRRSRNAVNQWCSDDGKRHSAPPPELWRALRDLERELTAGAPKP